MLGVRPSPGLAWLLLTLLALCGAPVRAEDTPTPKQEPIAAAAIAEASELLAAGDAATALPLCREALEARLAGYEAGHAAIAEAHAYLAWALYSTGEDERAIGHEIESAQILLQLPKADPTRALTLHLLGYMHRQRSDFAAAAKWWKDAVEAFEADGANTDWESIAWILSDLAEMHRLLGHPAQAESIQVRAVEVARTHLPENAYHATYLNNLGALQWDRGALDQAELAYREALRITLADPESTPRRRANAQLNLGVLLRDQWKHEAAHEHLTQALALRDEAFEPDDPDRHMIPLELGKLYAATGRLSDAIVLWEGALAELRKDETSHPIYEAQILDDMGRALLAREQPRRALGCFTQALELRQAIHASGHPEIAMSQIGLAEARMRLGTTQDVDRMLAEAVQSLRQRAAADEALARAHGLLARRALQRRDRDAAQREVSRALELLESLRQRRGVSEITRASFLAHHLELYALASDVALARNDARAALSIVESARARVFHEQLLLSQRMNPDAEAQTPSEREAGMALAAIQRQLDQHRATLAADDADGVRRMAELEAERERALERLRDAADERRLRAGAARPAATAETRLDVKAISAELLPGKRALLVYEIGATRSRVYALLAGRLRVYELSVAPQQAQTLELGAGPLTAAALDSAILRDAGALGSLETARGVTGARPIGEAATKPGESSRLHALFELLIPAELWQQVSKLEQCIVVPDAALHRLPLETLILRDAAQPVYWLDEGPILRYASSIASLRAQTQASRQQPEHTLRLLSLADPNFAQAPVRWALPALPGTRVESERALAAFADWPTASLHGSDATETRLRELGPRARYVHLATHGLVDETRSELLAALALSAPARASIDDDGFLYLHEIVALRWSCELAVLSACSTQRGLQLGGEGVFALSRAFQSAGARRAIASLWSVSDASTATLMGDFFARLAAAERAGQLPDYARALRDAKRALRQKAATASPYHWGAFVLSGAG